jgi:hypothetical protein
LPELPKPPLVTLPRPPWEQKPPTVPGVAGGVVTASEAGWNLVEYSDPATGQKVRFTTKPAVVALAEVRSGDFLNVSIPIIEIPKITVPSVSLPRPSQIPRIAREDFNNNYYCDLVAGKARDGAKEMAPPWPLDIVWGWFCDTLVYGIFYVAMYGIGFIVNTLWDSFIQPQVDKVQGEIDAVLSDFRDKSQAALDAFRDNLQCGLSFLSMRIEATVSQGLSSVIPTFYQMINLAPGQLITPVNTRNVTETSFEYYALAEGQVTHYIALGAP